MESNMTLGDIVAKIQRKFNTVVIITLTFVLVGVGITLILPKQYRAESQLVVIQKANPGIDSYTAQRSIDSNVDLLINLAYTDAFFSSFTVDNVEIRNAFPENLKDRRTQFARNVVVQARGTGFISVLTYDGSSELALTMNQVAVNKLIDQAKVLLGDTANIQIVNQPSLFDGVGRPDITINLLGSAIVGLAVAIGYVLSRKENTLVYDFGIDEEGGSSSEEFNSFNTTSVIPPSITTDTEYDSQSF